MSESNNLCSCVSWKLVHPCLHLFTHFSAGRSVHPLSPVAPAHSEFFEVSTNVRLRIIRVQPCEQTQLIHYKKRFSLSEEYWFTRWSKPLRNGSCNCSFRRSDRFSHLNDVTKKRLSNIPATRIVDLETFVERLLQETFFEAFQEYMVQRNSLSNGLTNLAFSCSDSDTDGTILRRKLSANDVAVLHAECTTVPHKCNNQSNTVQNKPVLSLKTTCDHNQFNQLKEKPCVLLLHGIGSTAEVWLAIINSLVLRGYEAIAPDLLGHGFSSAPNKPKAYNFQSVLSQMLAVFDHYVGARKCIIIGHSFGCSLATAVYKSRPQQIAQMVLISGGGPTPLAPPVSDNKISVLGCLQAVIKPLLFCGMKRSIFFSSRGKHFGVSEETTSVPSHVLEYYEKGQCWPEGDAAFHRRILIPTLLVHGLQDKQVTLVQECEMERTIPRAFLELIPLAGHVPMLETPEHLSHMILCFIDWWIR